MHNEALHRADASTRSRAAAKIEVKSTDAQPYDQTTSPFLMEIRISERSGLRGEGGFEGEFGKGSAGTLDYWFDR
jgi:hypothetical protein